MAKNAWKIGLVMGLLGGVAGMVAAIIVEPVGGTIITLVFVAVFGTVWMVFLRPIFRTQRLKKTGKPARGTILRVWDTGVTINNNPQIGLEVEVQAEGMHPWAAKGKVVISRLEPHLFQPGVKVHVRYDPRDPSKIAITDQGEAPSAGSQKELEQKLIEIDQFNKRLNAHGDLAPAIVMEVTPMGINLNGENPVLTLKVKVLPKGMEPFDAELAGPFSAESLYKYQPGKEIEVRYDRWATDRVTVAF